MTLHRPIDLARPLLLLACLIAFLGCAHQKTSYSAPGGPQPQVVPMTASSFRFEPDEILAQTGARLLLKVTNSAGIDHNLTVEDPQGDVLLDLTLPAGRTSSAELRLSQPGVYRFYCDKPMHNTLGMTGRIVTSPP